MNFFAAAACLVAAVGAILHFGQWSYLERLFGDKVQSFTTGVSERRQIELSDGSTVTLGARTQLSVHYTLERRVIFLERGEAWFSVADNPLRPFSVIAGGGAITALATQFDVRREVGSGDGDRVVVTVGTGAVEVGPPDATEVAGSSHQSASKDDSQPKWTPARLVRGQALAYDSEGPKGKIHSVDVRSVAAWTEGRLEYRHTPFKVVIPQVNGYSQKPIVLGDAAVEEMPYSGTVFEGQVPDWLQALQAAYPIEVTEDPERIIIRSRTPPNP